MTIDDLELKIEQRLVWSRWREDSARYYKTAVSTYGNNLDLLKLEEKIDVEQMIAQMIENNKGD